MRIAVLTSTPPSRIEGSGTFVALEALVHGLARLGHEVTLRPLRLRTRFHTFDRWLYNALVVAAPPAADLVVGVDLDGFLWARRRRGPFIVALKGVIADELRNERGWVRALLTVQARWERRNCARADRVVVPSEYSASVAVEAYAIQRRKVTVVPEPIDLARWHGRLAGVPRRPLLRPTVLSVARMYPRKRLGDLLEAAARLRARIPRLEVRIAGDGPEMRRLQGLHARLGLGETVTLLGALAPDALAVEYGSAHCFCLPSVQEGFGLVLAEAMAAGLPVVACRAAAVPEVVPDGRAGLLVSPRNPGELAQALDTVLGDERLRKELGDEGRRHVEAFDVDRVVRRFVEAVTA